jgi:hypothetical protein
VVVIVAAQYSFMLWISKVNLQEETGERLREARHGPPVREAWNSTSYGSVGRRGRREGKAWTPAFTGVSTGKLHQGK